jgi:hypothetical protein
LNLKLAKSAIIPQKYFLTTSIWVSKNAKGNDDFESVEKVPKNNAK